VKLNLLPEPGLPPCHTDTRRVEQILVNLLTNAIRHSPRGGEVQLSVGRDGANIVFIVRDQGPGVPEDELARIFDIYVTKAGEEREGIGLGLPLSRRLAQLMGGELFAVSRVNGGGEFVLQLPVATGAE
jgi:NtrC-family two-component system sensor histidine kinase KinB